MLLPFGGAGFLQNLPDGTQTLGLSGSEDGQAVPFEGIAARSSIGIKAGIGQDDDRRLQTLRAVDGEEPERISLRGGIADDLHFTPVEPVHETLQGGVIVRLKGECSVEQFLDRVGGFNAETLDELAATFHRAGQDRFEIAVGRGQIRAVQ